jgi:putative FmdB family regulatory protein
MPIYEYRCEECGDFEEMQRITDAPLTRCPKCRRKLRRLISNTSFQLKGSGWYMTDYARSGSGNGEKKDASSKTSEKTSEGASESKSEKKSEAKTTSSSTSEKPAS